ncbi:MAG: type II toxin-antitoxin system RelE/ParE family toxin [Deltaproteobacteria bacterium]|nr:type II toxin-antitoxin system RelE/ParE family toxin [Deltaproteobacteria bacterium]
MELHYFRDPRGRSPLFEWLEDLKDRKARTIIEVRIDRLSFGNFGDCRSLGHGLMELRIHFGPGYRIYFARRGEVIVLLLCGGEKGSQKSDLKKASTYWQAYREANNV